MSFNRRVLRLFSTKELSRYLRRNQTEAETVLWNRLRNRQLMNLKFLRQHPFKMDIDNRTACFIADFYCAEKKLVIEVDGGIHNKQKEYDDFRSYILGELGINVIRIKNEEVIEQIETTMDKIRLVVNSL